MGAASIARRGRRGVAVVLSRAVADAVPATASAGPSAAPLGAVGLLIATWGVLGVCALLFRAVWRLSTLALEPLRDGGLGPIHVVVYVVWIGFSIWSEGYRGFQKRVSPRVVARALYLAKHPRPLWVALAPAFCMTLFHATRRGLLTAWGVLVMVVTLVVIVGRIPQPWRGIIDAGVVIGLVWGIVAILWFFARALAGHPVPGTGELPVSARRE